MYKDQHTWLLCHDIYDWLIDNITNLKVLEILIT